MKNIENHSTCRIRTDGSKEWITTDGVRHRFDGPAFIYPNGFEVWHNECGQIHRDDGPAIIYSNPNIASWYLGGKRISFDKWCKELRKTPEDILFLKIKYGI